MNGETVKYHKYEGSSGKISIPTSIAKSLNWDHKNEIGMIIRTIDGKQGLFLWKREKEEKLHKKTRAQAIDLESKI
ncbi:hypothetical protein LCGC14_1065400 [marine sediment metagenome]|uniref:SpoVT-AbrB domain-containing protein n=1 Tax=marine sediment metagenome TaxID=412755 RepID=A0A0F9MPM0_9ZZZZ